MEKLKCNLCEADKYKVIIRGKDRLHGIPGEFDYVRCSNCNLVYMNPQLSLKELQKYYPLEYKPYNTIKSQEELSIKKKEKIEQQQLYGNLNKDSRLLDVGCGSGTFIKKIHHITGCKVYGVDISQDAGKDAAGAELFHGTICDAKYKNDFFDAVTAWEYLEHVNYPVEVLNEIYRILKPGGIFMLSCPNYDSFNAKVFKSK